MAKKYLIIILILSIFLTVSSSILQPSVINGELVFDGEFPFMGLVIRRYHPELEKMECGCTLIHPGWAITAAHCVVDPWGDFDDIDAVFNLSNIRDPWENARRIKVDTIYFHPDYTNNSYPPEGKNDIALLRLEEEIDIEPVKLAEPQDSILYKANTNAKVLGWGITRIGSIWPGRPDLLRQGDIQVIGYPGCYDTLEQENVRHLISEFCAGTHTLPVIGSAGGDSGGPLLVKRQDEWVQTGIVSRGGGSLYTLIGFPGIYSKISYYYPWITNTINAIDQAELEEWKPEHFFDHRLFNNSLEVRLLRAYEFDINVTIYNLSGQRLYTRKINKQTSTVFNIDTSGWKNKIILLTFFIDGQVLAKKIFIP